MTQDLHLDFRTQYVTTSETEALLLRQRHVAQALLKQGKHLFSKPVEKKRER